ncbi:MAG: oxygen-independent coproporphyrinogen III oxidase [Candidatus Kapabacteria bacterium]|nr:oxygen-independent coproporphyrinogen III oxidase [Candidatus Kapabacteria bacterium]
MQQLYDKYREPVPRYTSYPPATKFADNFTGIDYISALKESNNWKPENISVYVHIPFCKKMCHFCGCNAILLKRKDPITDYINAVISEIEMTSKHLDSNRKISQIHFGGGTPNAIEAEYLVQIVDKLREKFDFIENAEIAIECNPAYIEYEYLDILIQAGFNRFSFGIQDFDEKVLEYSNRDPSKIPLDELFSYLKSSNPKIGVNLDFIYGLPGQTVNGFVDTIRQAAELRPERLVTFSYAHVPWVNKSQNYLEKIGLPDPIEKMEMFLRASKELSLSGYKQIGLDHFVLESDELYEAGVNHDLHRNFQGYCTRRTTGQVYAFGVSGISQLEKSYIQNIKTTKEYIESIQSGEFAVIKGYNLSANEIVIREVINYFMCNKRLDFDKIAMNLSISADEIKSLINFDSDKLAHFIDDGIIRIHDGIIEITDLGVIFIRNVAAVLDPCFESGHGKYSRSV